MPTYSKSDRLESLRFAREVEKALKDVMKQAPNDFCRSAINVGIKAIRRNFGFSDARKKAIVVWLVGKGRASYDELVQDSRMSRAEVIRVVNELSKTDELRIVSVGGGRRGRPQVRIFLA